MENQNGVGTVAADGLGEAPKVTKVTKESWKALGAAFTGWCLDAMDWMILALVLPMIGKEFGSSMTAMGGLATATLGGAALAGLFGGMLADYFGRVKMLMITMIWYATFTFLCGFSETYTQLLILRFLTGFGLGAEWGVGAALLTETWPAKYRAWATACTHTGWPIGYGLASLCFMFLVPIYGWRSLFFVGIAPAIFAIIIRLSVSEPEVWKHSRAKAKASTEKQKLPIIMLFQGIYRNRTLFACMLACGALMASWAQNTWIPTYLINSKGLDIIRSGTFLIALNAGGVVGHHTMGLLAGKIGRRAAMGLGLTLAAICTVIYVSIDSADSLFWFGPVFGFGTYGLFGLFGAYLSELYPPEARATGASFIFNFGRVCGMASPVVIGVLATMFDLGFAIKLTALLNIFGALALLGLPETLHEEKNSES